MGVLLLESMNLAPPPNASELVVDWLKSLRDGRRGWQSPANLQGTAGGGAAVGPATVGSGSWKVGGRKDGRFELLGGARLCT